MQVSRDSPMPVWHQIEMILAEEIAAGLLAPGSRLPNEAAIAARFGVHRHTARRALATLADKGAVRIQRGLGTFVEPPAIRYPITERTRFTATLHGQNRAATHELLDGRTVEAEADVAAALGLAVGAPVARLHLLNLADGVPVSTGVTFFPGARFPGLIERFRERPSVTAVLESFGVPDYRRAETRIIAAMPSAEDASRLRQSRREPVLAVESLDVDPEGAPVSFGRVLFAGERVQLVVGRR